MKTPKILLTTLALAATTAALSAADAAANWDKNCKACHGADGKGETPMGKKLALKDFTDAKYQATFTDAAGHQGHQGRRQRRRQDQDESLAEDLNDDDIKALVAKVRAFKK